MNKLIKLKLHGDLAKIGAEWNFATKSVNETLYALNTLTNNSFTNYFIKNDKLKAKYRILINGKDFISPVEELNEENIEMINSSELVMQKENIETIDIVPFIENSDSKALGILSTILGVILIVVGIIIAVVGAFVGATPLGLALIGIGLGLAAGGVAALLSRPPNAGSFKNPDLAGQESYLFSGPSNVIGEGGPVPIGYGRVLLGSQVISAAYKIINFVATPIVTTT